MRLLRNKKDGTIYEWDDVLARHPLCEEVTKEQAYPEQFIPKKQIGRKTKLALDTADIPKEPVVQNEAINEDASRGLPQ
jgi:hypothetical protein